MFEMWASYRNKRALDLIINKHIKTGENLMKKFEHRWDDEVFLLHIQLERDLNKDYDILIIRNFYNKSPEKEVTTICDNVSSHRFIVSRSCPGETNFFIEYPEAVILEAFIIDDRAYYPTESFYRG